MVNETEKVITMNHPEEVIQTLEQISKPFLKRFKDNKMKLNPDHLILSGKENREIEELMLEMSLKIRKMKGY